MQLNGAVVIGLQGGAVAVLGKNIWRPDPSSFGRQQRLSKITIEPIKNVGLGKIWGRGLCPLAPP